MIKNASETQSMRPHAARQTSSSRATSNTRRKCSETPQESLALPWSGHFATSRDSIPVVTPTITPPKLMPTPLRLRPGGATPQV